MNIEEARIYCLSKNKATEDMPFGDDYVAFRIMNKIFAGINLLHQDELVLKCNPDIFDDLTAQYPSIAQAWHWHKKHWIQIDLNGDDITAELVKTLTDKAYDHVVSKLPKKVRETISD